MISELIVGCYVSRNVLIHYRAGSTAYPHLLDQLKTNVLLRSMKYL